VLGRRGERRVEGDWPRRRRHEFVPGLAGIAAEGADLGIAEVRVTPTTDRSGRDARQPPGIPDPVVRLRAVVRNFLDARLALPAEGLGTFAAPRTQLGMTAQRRDEHPPVALGERAQRHASAVIREQPDHLAADRQSGRAQCDDERGDGDDHLAEPPPRPPSHVPPVAVGRADEGRETLAQDLLVCCAHARSSSSSADRACASVAPTVPSLTRQTSAICAYDRSAK